MHSAQSVRFKVCVFGLAGKAVLFVIPKLPRFQSELKPHMTMVLFVFVNWRGSLSQVCSSLLLKRFTPPPGLLLSSLLGDAVTGPGIALSDITFFVGSPENGLCCCWGLGGVRVPFTSVCTPLTSRWELLAIRAFGDPAQVHSAR